ncbi:hypothetical protein [Pseudomonas phage Persinger]|uniref:Uncharacterized protein n=1 Tax=Pseudomonas phage Persinger TaxID=2749430 RepID=A0A7D7JBK8_9CAUD|nr:head-tail joining [Pseudomonas phage Persinger]QMP19229.1 hypothetical protein [Pseudomonas phage Persinger]
MGEKLVSCGSIPGKIGAGLTFDVLLTLTAFPAPDWSVSVLLRGKSAIDLQTTAEGSQHRLRVNAATTATWAPGDYWFTMRATRGDEVVEVEQGQLTITPDLSAVTGEFDGRSQAQIALEAIDAVLAKRATLDQERYRINNRELYRTPIADLLKLRSYYAEQVRRERAKACGRNPFGATVRVRLR